VLVAYAESDPEAQARIAAFRQGCANWAGQRATTFEWSLAGERGTLIVPEP
jgi:hypothetical protein